MAEQKTRAVASNEGLMTSWVTAGSNLAERGTETFFGTLQDVRSEINRRVLSAIDFVESLEQGGVKLARTVTGRIDQLWQDAIRVGEEASLDVVSTARDTGRGAADLVSRSVANLTSRRDGVRKAA